VRVEKVARGGGAGGRQGWTRWLPGGERARICWRSLEKAPGGGRRRPAGGADAGQWGRRWRPAGVEEVVEIEMAYG
jgi:hypothetical protein